MIDEPKATEIVVSHVLVFPNDANSNGNMFGGRIMEIMDSNASMAATRFALGSHHCVTASVDNVQFRLPVHIGDILRFTSRVVYTGRTSMVIRVDVHRYDRDQASDELCTSAHSVFVAMDGESKPTPVPKLALASDSDQQAWEAGKAVRERLLRIGQSNALA